MLPLDNIVSYIATGAVALFSYLVKHYFSTIKQGQEDLLKELSKLEGKLDLLSKDIKDNTIEGASLRTEVKALWRFVDNANQRASDRRAS